LNAPPEINVDSGAFDPELNRVRLAGTVSAWLAKLVGKPAMAAFRRDVSALTAELIGGSQA
jgi:hypothetical protein